MIRVVLSLLLFASFAYAQTPDPPIGNVVPPPPIDAAGNIVNPAADPGDNTDISKCDDIYYFNDETGNDGNSCTSPSQKCKSADKWKSLSVGPGDCLLYERGSTWVDDDPDWENLPNGTASAYVTVGSFGTGARPKITLATIHPSFTFNGKSYLNFDRLHVDGVNIWRINTGSHHIAWRYVRTVNGHDTCMVWRSGGSGHPHHMTLVGVACESTDDGDSCHNGDTNGCGEGFYIGGNDPPFQGALDVYILGCYTTNLFNESVSVKALVRRVTIDGCLMEGNQQRDDPGIINTGNSDSDSANLVVRNNVVINNFRDGGDHSALRLGRGTTAYNNLVVDNQGAWCFEGESSSLFWYNTCFSNDKGFRRDPTIPNANVKSNIGESGSSVPGNIDAVAGLFVDSANDDFRLKSGSAAINLYTNCRGIETDIAGMPRRIGPACDAGAWELCELVE